MIIFKSCILVVNLIKHENDKINKLSSWIFYKNAYKSIIFRLNKK